MESILIEDYVKRGRMSMILCCTTCGKSFYSESAEEKCDYCYNDTETLITDDELSSMPQKDIPFISECLKEKYKNENNPKYNSEIWSVRESKETSESLKKQMNELSYNISTHKLTTGYNFEGYKITTYINVINGNVVLGTGIFSEWSASIDDMLGVTSSPFENKMEKAKELAIEKLIRKSALSGGNAIIGIDFDFFTIGNNMIAISANGTSVMIEEA